jgi:glycosyl transferase family 25
MNIKNLYIVLFLLLIILLVLILLYIFKKNNDYFSVFQTKLNKIDTNNSLSLLNDYIDNIKVISLPERENYIKNILSTNNITFEIFPAILKSTLKIDVLYANNILDNTNKLSTGEIACYLSHLEVLKTFLHSNYDTILIFEDDIKISYDNLNKINLKKSLENIPPNFDILYLGKCWERCWLTEPVNEYWNTAYNPSCLHSYIVSRKGASKIINMCSNISIPIDNVIGINIKNKKIKAYSLTKSIFYQNREDIKSTLNHYGQKECIIKKENLLYKSI